MTLLELEVMTKFHQLDADAQKRVRDMIVQETASIAPSEFDFEAWFRDMEALRQEIIASHGGTLPSMDVVGILRAIRDGEDE